MSLLQENILQNFVCNVLLESFLHKDGLRYDSLFSWQILFPSGFYYVKKPKKLCDFII